MHTGYLRTAFILAAITVALGAFGAHGLDGKVADKAVKTFETAVRYQFFHVIALALAGILYKTFPNNRIKTAGIFFLLGMLFFCGSLYVLTYSIASVSPNFKWAGPVTPVGGVFFILGWVYLALGIKKQLPADRS
jgi:uncharacterized membrane protein YgdD (TMEM256/DUF423 family)